MSTNEDTGEEPNDASTELDDNDAGFSPEIERGEDSVRADCGAVSAVVGGQLTLMPNGHEAEIVGYGSDYADERHVTMELGSGEEPSGMSISVYLTPDEARDIARRLEAAASVASGE